MEHGRTTFVGYESLVGDGEVVSVLPREDGRVELVLDRTPMYAESGGQVGDTGLVRTSEDFGSQGAQPVYPQVLDAVALGFIDSGWDQKQLVKSIVMSRTYRQRSLADAATMA